jgi:DNA-binding transcriptional MerR regulator
VTAVAERVYRMKDLCELTGLSRQAIHFYIQQGLVPEGRKTGRNMAWYGPEHVERLQLVRRLQEERFLPLKAIRALLDGETAGLHPHKRALLTEVGARLAPRDQRPATVDAADACARHGVSAAELDRFVELGVIVVRDEGGRRVLSTDQLWVLDVWGQLRAAGFTAALGFVPDDVQIYEDAIAKLFQRETAMLVDRLDGLPPEQVAVMIERVMPLIHATLIHFHTNAVRNFFAALERP